MRLFSSSLRKSIAILILSVFSYSLFGPFHSILFAGVPDVILSYSSSPAKAGLMTITATYSETLNGSGVYISINQSGSTDISLAPMTNLGSGTIYTYDYTVNADNGSTYLDGPTAISLSGAVSLSTSQVANAPALNSFTIDTTPPVVTLVGSGNLTILSGSTYTESGATYVDAIDGGGSILSAWSGSVNTNLAGTYILEYRRVDAAGNTGSTTRSVRVLSGDLDILPPTVTLVGSGTVDTTIGSGWIDPGASWVDDTDGFGLILTASSGSVNTSASGTYILEYTYTDMAGNAGNTVSRTVNLSSGTIDTTPPVVTLVGSGTIAITLSGTYTESGATWTDNVDGAGFIASASSGSVNTSATGTYILTYQKVDAAGNTGSTTRSVVVSAVADTTPPVITLVGSSTGTVEYGTTYIDSGATWTDNVDGSGVITSYNSGTINTGALGTYIVGYEYTDGAGNVGTGKTRSVTVVDTTPPVVTLIGGSNITLVLGDTYIEPGISWTDAVDGSGISMSGSTGSTFSSLGTYPLEYSFIDSSGNVGNTVSRTIRVVASADTTPPVITLVGSSTGTVEYGATYIDSGATWTDNVDGSGVITSYNSGTINTGALGTYIVGYEYTDGAGNVGTGQTRSVTVVDTTAPTITLVGSASMTISLSGTYTESGATWIDTRDGSGTLLVATSGSVNTSATGTYILTYQKVDAAGNTGSTTRTVTVSAGSDIIAPVVTVVGSDTLSLNLGAVYTESGATWTDNVDGAGFIASASSGSVNTSATGTYILTYQKVDAAGNTGSTTRSVTVSGSVDTTPPVVSLSGPSTISLDSNAYYIMGQVTGGATSVSVSGGSSGTVAITPIGTDFSILVYLTQNSTNTLLVSASDASGNIGTGAVIVTEHTSVNDYQSPLTISGGTLSGVSMVEGASISAATGVTVQVPVVFSSGGNSVTLPSGTRSVTSLASTFDATSMTIFPATITGGLLTGEISTGSVFFGITNTSLHFSRPIRVDIAVPGYAGSTVKVKVRHGTNNFFETTGLTGDSSSSCTAGISSSPSDDAVVSGGIATIYSCSASTFVAVTSTPSTTSTTSTTVTGNGGPGAYWFPFDAATNSIHAGTGNIQNVLGNTSTGGTLITTIIDTISETHVHVGDILRSSAKAKLIILIRNGFIRNNAYFHPDRLMKRHEFIKIVALVEGFTTDYENENDIHFRDVMRGDPAEGYIAYAADNEWIDTEDGLFRPNEPITLREAQEILDAITGEFTLDDEDTDWETKITKEDGAVMIFDQLQEEE